MEEKFSSQYDPKGIEPGIYKFWEENGCFKSETADNRESYVIVIPPPNVTGYLHIGHALNNTIQDVLIRWKRMSGFNSLWVPGTDHAGIATQNVVERQLKGEGLDRKSVGREAFVERVWNWKEEYGSQIIYQLKKLGASCDWSRLRFTMDSGLSSAVNEAFIRLYKKGLIYKGERIINWCPRCVTALSDEEVDYKDEDSTLYYIRYPLQDGDFIEVATTRPETMLGDTAVAVHPEDERYKKLVGKSVILPFVDRTIPVISDRSVEKDFGTGALKITPGHDPADFEIGRSHRLEIITVIDSEGIMNSEAGEFKGLDRFQCRKIIVERLRDLGNVSKEEPYSNRVGHCYRCNSAIEPHVSYQWFVRMEGLAKPAIEAAEEGRIVFHPERWQKVYLHWLYNIKDWCISRQIWWGHRIPVWYCRECYQCDSDTSGSSEGVVVSVEKPIICACCGSGDFYQDPDVLDTWFSSWLWPFSVFGWPEETDDLKVFYPTDTLVTAQEILFFWVARMVMAGVEFMGDVPFRNIYIHGTVRDKTGVKMSKSLGNVIDPLKVIDEFGSDSLRFSLISMTAAGQDVFLSPTFYIKGRNFMNKVWNAARFITNTADSRNIEKIEPLDSMADLNFTERWIIAELNDTIENVSGSLEKFRLNEALNTIYDFFWHDFCDWYIEISKVYQDHEEYFKSRVIPVLFHVFSASIRLMHPFIPFITEHIWHIISEYTDCSEERLIAAGWPAGQDACSDDNCRSKMRDLMEIVVTIRDIKTRFGIPLSKSLNCYMERVPDRLETSMISKLAGAGKISTIGEVPGTSENVLKRNLGQGVLGVSLDGIVDFSKEIEKLDREREKLSGYLLRMEKKLSNQGFLEKAPQEVIRKENAKIEDLKSKITNIEKDIKFIKQRGD